MTGSTGEPGRRRALGRGRRAAGRDGRVAGRDALLLAAAAALSGFTLLRGYGPHDEGLMLGWAGRIADGQWPYRDFWCNYAPGQPLVLAGLVKVFGPSLVSWRVLRVAVDAVVALLVYRLVGREAGGRWALAAWAGSAAAMAFPTGPGPNPTALALGLGALLAARRSPGAAGALAGLAVVVRPEIGLAAAVGASLEARRGGAWGGAGDAGDAGSGDRPAGAPPDAARAALVLAVAVGVAGAGLAPFAVVAGGAMADQTLGFLAIQDLQRLPFPLEPEGHDPNRLLERLFPAILVGGTALWVAWALARRPPPSAWALAPLLAAGLAYLLARTDEFHLVPLSVALAAALAVAGAREPRAAPRAALATALALIVAHGLERRAGQLLHPPAQAPVPAAAADGVRTVPADARALALLLPAVRRRTPHGEPVLVAPPRFDRVRVGHPLLNVLLDRPNPTRYDVMQPGVVTTRSVQREMARDLRRAPVVVRWLAPTARLVEPNGSGRSSGVRLLDLAIARDFRPEGRFGDYLVLVRRG